MRCISKHFNFFSIGEDGKKYVVKGPVHPRDVWTDRGLKYVVHFNDLNQPIRKGGSILVSFINDIAKREKFCPVGVKYWHKLNEKFKRDISIAVRVCKYLKFVTSNLVFKFVKLRHAVT